MTEQTFRDLNKNGRLDAYEDSHLPVEERVADLLGQMTLEEKAGLMFHTMIGMNPDGTLQNGMGGFGPIFTTRMVAEQKINHFNVLAVTEPGPMTVWPNPPGSGWTQCCSGTAPAAQGGELTSHP